MGYNIGSLVQEIAREATNGINDVNTKFNIRLRPPDFACQESALYCSMVMHAVRSEHPPLGKLRSKTSSSTTLQKLLKRK